MKKSKKIIIIIVTIIVVIALIIGGVVLFNNMSENKRVKDFETATRQYYDKHMANLYGSDESIVTLKAIRSVIENNDETYDIKSLKKCDDESSMVFILENREVVNQIMDLKCN